MVRRRDAVRASLAMAATAAAMVCAVTNCGNQQAASPGAPSNAAAALGAVQVAFHWPQAAPTQTEARGSEVGARLIPAATETIELTVSGTGISPDITRTVTRSEVMAGEVTVLLYVPPGTARRFLALAKDAGGRILVGLSSTLDIGAGVVTTTDLELGPPMKNGKIAYSVCLGGSASEIYTMDPDGSNVTQLTNNAFWDAEPCFSPDGTRIIFVSDRDGPTDIYVMDADGGNATRLTFTGPNNYWPKWSPYQDKVVFNSFRDGNNEVYIMYADGSSQANLTNHPANDVDGALRPDGDKVVFSTDRDGTQDIYLMDVDGSNLVSLTQGPGDDTQPTFSGDLTKIVFVSDRDGGGTQVYVMNADGSNPVNLTQNLALRDSIPAWSEDGTKIAFVRYDPGGGTYSVCVMDADGSNVVSLVSDLDVKCGVDWQPAF